MWIEALYLLIRGPHFGARRALAERERLLLSTFLSLGKGYGHFDAAIGSLFFLRATRLALSWGVPDVASQGAGYVGALFGFEGTPTGVARAERWIAHGEKLALEHGDAYGLAFSNLAHGMTLCCSGDWTAAVTSFDSAAANFDEHFAKSDWEATVAKTTSLFALMHIGDFTELGRRAQLFIQQASRRGDLALEVESSLNFALFLAVSDQLEDARDRVERTIRLWKAPSYTFQHWIALRCRTMLNMLEERYEIALRELETETRSAEQAGLMAMQVVRIEAHETRGRALLGAAGRSNDAAKDRLLHQTRKLVTRLRREKQRAHALAPSYVLEAGAAWLNDSRAAAIDHLDNAVLHYQAANMQTHAAAARFNVARMRGSRDLQEQAAQTMRSNGVVCPERWARAQLPVELR
jgi:hypothetical protein